MFAVVEIDGHQFKVSEGDVIRISRLDMGIGDHLTLDKVLLLNDDEKIISGHPYIDEASIDASVIFNGKDEKKVIVKYKRRKDYRRKQGHRQSITDLKIERITH